MRTTPRSRRTRLALALLLPAVLAAPASAGQEFPEFGGPGGGAFRSECPPWSHVVGFTGRVGAWLISIEPLCAPLQPVEQKIGPGAPNGRPFGGQSGGNAYSVSCPIGYALGSWVFDMVVNTDEEPTFVNAIGLDCRLAGSPGQTYRAQIGDDLGAPLTMDVAFIAQMGMDRPGATNQCPPGELVTGIRGRSGIYIDALGLICGAPPTAQEYAQCTAYRDEALRAVAESQGLQCGNTGDRWSADGGLHMGWCTTLGAGRAAATQAETAARADAIQKCRLASLNVRDRQLGDLVVAKPDLGVKTRPPSDIVVAQPEVKVVQRNPGPRAVMVAPAVGELAVQQPQPQGLGEAMGRPMVAAVPTNYAGVWSTRTDKNWSYEISFSQTGSQVAGTYVVQNGDTGRIRGTVTGNALSFEWDQDGGYTGTGQFTLGADGNSFSGSYKSNPHPALTDPALLGGTWSGTRK